MELDWMKIAVDLGSFGMIAWLVFYTFSKMLPQTAEKFSQELREERESSERNFRELTSAVDRLSKLIIVHDATVRGQEEHNSESILQLLGRYQEEEKRD